MSTAPTSPDAASLPDIFTPLQPLLLLLSLGNRALTSRPNDPLPQALAAITDFGKADIDRITGLTDSAGLYVLLREDPESFANYLLLGRLTFASPLGASLIAHVTKSGADDDPDAAPHRPGLLASVLEQTDIQSQLLENYLLDGFDEEDRDDAAQERAAFRAALEAAFADWQHSLGALVLAAPAPVLPPDEDERGWSIRPLQMHLDALRLAVTILQLMPALGTPHFADAVQRLPDFHPQRLEELQQYLEAAEPEQQLPLTRLRGLLLYIAAHITLLALLSDVLDGEGLDDLLLSRREQEGITTEMVSRMREGTTIMLSAYIDLIRQHEADAGDFQALEARLTPVLALAATC